MNIDFINIDKYNYQYFKYFESNYIKDFVNMPTLILIDGIALGMIDFEVSDNYIILNSLEIISKYKRQGYGTKIINFLMEEYNKDIKLYCKDVKALKFYKTFNIFITNDNDYNIIIFGGNNMISKEMGYKLLEKLKVVDKGRLKVKELIFYYEDFKAITYVYKDEESMNKHRDEMELKGYKTYQCGCKGWFNGDEIIDKDSTFFKYEVRIPTATYGKPVKGLGFILS